MFRLIVYSITSNLQYGKNELGVEHACDRLF